MMEKRHKVLISNLPSQFTKGIHDCQRNFSVTMLMHDDDSIRPIPCSGTLAQISNFKGIISARHVWDEAKKHEFLLALVGQGNYAFETKYLDPVIPEAVGVLKEFGVHVPDLCFIKLPPKYTCDLEAKGKVFFNVDKRIKAKSFMPDMTQGYWTVFGNPDAWLETEKKQVPSFIYGTGLSKQFEEAGWDYFVMNLDIPANPDIPTDFSGMSGGGIWWTRWGCDKNQKRFVVANPSQDIIVAGVSFFQTGSHNRMLIGHGPNSIYELLYQYVHRTI